MNRYKKILLVIFAFLCLLYVSGCSLNKDTYRLKQTVIDYVNKNGGESITEIDLSELTLFEWDKAMVFKYPTSAQTIEQCLSVKYEKSLDLVSGIIFVSGDKIIYEERFKSNYKGVDALPPEFFIYHNADINAKPNYRVFDTKDDIFICEKNTSDGYTYYVLKPKY
ncbi:MAG: hypothetical protein IJL87_02580 [Clostridia bacterium]|nr:hypothetical protein [Clostridia bacterium]